MKAILLMVGTELLNGATVDTNSIFMAEELNKYGIEIESKFVVRDFVDEIEKALAYSKKNSELVIISGGMGPTLDDITKESVAKFLNKKLVVDEKEKDILIDKFKKAGLNFANMNLKEVEKPEGSIVFKNDVGMADGLFIEGIAIFPGVPRELHNLFPKFLKWYSKECMKSYDEIYIKDIITIGIPESTLEAKVKEYFVDESIFYEFLVKDYGILIRLQSKISNKKSVEKIVEKLYNTIGENICGEDNERVETLLVEILKARGESLSLAESCTGGMIASKIVSVSGASEVFKEGLVTYSNNSKIERLNVLPITLEKYGAVSKEVASEMLRGLDTNLAISVTGVAGPSGGTAEKPVGLVYIGIKYNGNVSVEKYNFRGDRDRIREKTTIQALFTALKKIKIK